MNFPLITIPDPAAVAGRLSQEVSSHYPLRPSYGVSGWYVVHTPLDSPECMVAYGTTPDELLADIRRQRTENDPLAKLRKDAEARGYGLIKLPTD